MRPLEGFEHFAAENREMIIVKTKGSLEEYVMVEIQGDLLHRDENVKDCSGNFVGDVLFNQFGHPILLVGHHIVFGAEKKLAKPFAVIEKVERIVTAEDPPPNQSILDSTINIENRTKAEVEYQVRAIIKKKLVFSQRPRPIINFN